MISLYHVAHEDVSVEHEKADDLEKRDKFHKKEGRRKNESKIIWKVTSESESVSLSVVSDSL